MEGGEYVVEPGERHALVGDAAAQHDVLEFLPGVGRGGGLGAGEVPQLPCEVVREPVAVRLVVPLDLADQRGRVVEGRTADLHGEVVADALGFDRLVQPLGERGAAGGGDGVLLLVRPALLRHVADVEQPVALHALEDAVDLLVGGGPEVSDGPLEPPGQLIARARLLQQGDEDRVFERHTPILLCN